MTIVFLLSILIGIAALARPFGADSRNLTDHSYQRDNLWSR